mgnify:CR=1 FL=1
MVVGAKCRPRIITGTVPTSTGTVDYTTSGEGTPVGGIITLSRVTALGTITAHASFSWGVFDGTRERVVFGYDRDNLGTQDSASGADNDGTIVRLYDGAAAIEIEAIFDSFITDGVRIDWTTVSGTAYQYSLLLYYGTDVECYAWDAVGASTAVTITPGFAADFCHTMQARSIDGTATAEMRFEIGFAGRTSTKNTCVAVLADDNTGTTRTRRRSSIADLGRTIRIGATDTLGGISLIGNWTSTEFDLNGTVSGVPGAGPRIAGLAVYAGGYNVHVGDDEDTKTSVGTESITAPGFRPAFVQMIYGAVNAGTNYQNSGSAGCGMTDFSTETSISLSTKNNQATSLTTSYSEESMISQIGTGGTAVLYEATNNGKLDDGFSLSWDVANATARAYRYVVIEEPFSAADGAGSFPIATGTGVGALKFTGTGAAVLPLMTGTGSGSSVLTITGSGTAVLPLATGTGAGLLKFTGTGAGILPLPTGTGIGDGIATVSGTGAAVLPLPEATGVGLLKFTGTGAGTLPLVEASGAGLLKFTGTGAAVLPLLTGTGIGDVIGTVTGTGAAVLPLPEASGAGLLKFTGTGAGTLPLVEAVGAGGPLSTVTGTGAAILPLLTGTGAGTFTLTGSGAAVLPLLTGIGAGTLIFVGSGAGTLPLVVGSGAGTLSFIGTSAGTLPLVTGTGAGILSTTGTGAGILPLTTGTGTGSATLSITGSGAGVLPLLTGTGTGIPGGQAVCASLLLGTYSPASTLLGSYSPAAVLTGTMDEETVLAGTYTLSEALTGRYNNVTTLTGGIC